MQRTLPKKLAELGRIRIGDREPNRNGNGTHPHKLDVFRLTSSNGSLLHFAASAYGGQVQPWTGDGAPTDEYHRPTHFELYTTVNALDVLIPTFSAVTLAFEQWSAGGCQRRCTGEVITHCPLQEALIGTACTCPTDDHERQVQATTGKACSRILRLNVLLHDLPGMGVWRLETKGFYATAELLGTLEMLQMAGQEHTIIEAVLRLEHRRVKKPGAGEGKGTLQFVVPVLWPTFTPRQILASAAARGMLLMAPGESQQAPAASAAQATDDLFGDGAGDVFRSPAPSPHAIWGTIQHWYTLAGREAQYAEFQAWACKRYHVASLAAIGERDLEEMAARVYAILEPLIVARQQTPPQAAQASQEPTGSDDAPSNFQWHQGAAWGTQGASEGPERPDPLPGEDVDPETGEGHHG